MTMERELEIEALADWLRARLYVYSSVPLDLKTTLMRIGDLNITPRASIQLLPKAQLKYDAAYTDGNTKTIYLPDTLPDQLGPEFPYNRFTVAHELSHVALGHTGVRSRALHGRDFRKHANVPGAWLEESEADSLASAFLMPEKIVIGCHTPEELVKRCWVSLDAARIRKETLVRRMRRARGEARSIPDKTLNLIEEVFRTAGTKPKSIKVGRPERS